MVKVFTGTDNQFYMDGYLQSNLDSMKIAVANDWDMLLIVDGYEGVGKSFFAHQIAYYCDPTLSIDRVVFSPNDFIATIKSAKKYQAVIYDEAYGGLSSRGTISNINKSIVKVLTEIRQKNLFVFIVMPSFFELDKYPAIHRSRALLHVYAGNEMTRGFFRFYNMSKKKTLYMTGKKFYSYKGVKANFYGRFPKFYPLDLEEYKKKKLFCTTRDEDTVERSDTIKKKLLTDISKNLRDYYNFSVKDIRKVMDVSDQSVRNYLKT